MRKTFGIVTWIGQITRDFTDFDGSGNDGKA